MIGFYRFPPCKGNYVKVRSFFRKKVERKKGCFKLAQGTIKMWMPIFHYGFIISSRTAFRAAGVFFWWHKLKKKHTHQNKPPHWSTVMPFDAVPRFNRCFSWYVLQAHWFRVYCGAAISGTPDSARTTRAMALGSQSLRKVWHIPRLDYAWVKCCCHSLPLVGRWATIESSENSFHSIWDRICALVRWSV